MEFSIKELKIRFATIEDAKDISDICSKAWRITYANLYSKQYIDKVIDELFTIDRIVKECRESSSDWHGYIVAHDGQHILGCIGGASESETGFIYIFYVDPDYKGQGIGSALLEFLTKYQKENYGINRQEVYVTTDNMLGIPFYKKCGFKLVEVVPNWIDESEGTQNKYQRLV
ncbi:GNAT family N-acetyltransferase [Helcococcus kunzii]|uniref:GNAT family N-acetyltransferase n=1 Tax=Helcococcus kunzii TaxID=40091 RepID=UPI001BAFC93C|nr:N-acetyltransferase [Helcococcus kunzii]QUY65624.1 GNAT family N-acetyltransferase [Helcococcus kunzii]